MEKLTNAKGAGKRRAFKNHLSADDRYSDDVITTDSGVLSVVMMSRQGIPRKIAVLSANQNGERVGIV